MDIDFADIEHVLARSRVRVQILLALAATGPATVAQIARQVGVRRERVRAALFGFEPEYAVERSLVPLGLVRVRTASAGKRATLDLTPEGALIAKRLPEAWLRHAEASGGARLLAYARRAGGLAYEPPPGP